MFCFSWKRPNWEWILWSQRYTLLKAVKPQYVKSSPFSKPAYTTGWTDSGLNILYQLESLRGGVQIAL